MRSKLKKLIIACGYVVYKIVRTPLLWYWKIRKIQTKGVRVLIVCKNEVLLVRHWYNSLWVMPGGGIHTYEIAEQAAIREIKEEVGLNINQLDYLLGLYENKKEGKNDMVHCFVVELEHRLEIPKRRFNIEIADSAWFDINVLPTSTSRATIERIEEYKNKDSTKKIRIW